MELHASLPSLLLPWYDAHVRPLPWRENITPYSVWISEIMLQQTRIEAAKGYYKRFLEALPDVASLAAADEQTVLKLWEGLGYYSRARNLHKAAKIIVNELGGQLPDTAAALRKLPGIGEYTAGAVASIAFGKKEPAVDGNVLRICARLTRCPDSIADPTVKKCCSDALRAVYPDTRCGAFTSAVMELGETVCTPGTPDCSVCPLTGICASFAHGDQTDFPVMPEKKPRRIQPRTVLLLEHDGRFALRKRPDTGLLAGLWEFPGPEGEFSREQVLKRLTALGCEPEDAVPCGNTVHIFTHLEWHMTGWRVVCRKAPDRFVWVTPEELRADYPLPTAFRAYKSLLSEGRS